MTQQLKDDVPKLSMAAAAAFIEAKEMAGEVAPQANGQRNEVVEAKRELGVTRKRTQATREIFDEVVKKYGCPIEAMAKIGFDTKVDTDIRLAALKEFASYGHSKLKTVEHTGADGAPLEFKQNVINNILTLINAPAKP